MLAAPRTIPQLMTIHGIGQQKADRYGAAICALCRGEAVSVIQGFDIAPGPRLL